MTREQARRIFRQGWNNPNNIKARDAEAIFWIVIASILFCMQAVMLIRSYCN
jgi:hypothetical protein